MPTWGQALKWGIKELATPSAKTDCLRLMTDNTPYNLLDVYKLSEHEFTDFNTFRSNIARCKLGEPVAYITGRQDFWQNSFFVNNNVLIPRHDSEIILETICQKQIHGQKILELGVGSGAIIISYLLSNKSACGFASDICFRALAVAETNMRNLACYNLTLRQGSWFEPWLGDKFDIIISNPPYIDEQDRHLESLSFEPRHALVAKTNGFHDLWSIIDNAHFFLEPGGWLILEHGAEQNLLDRFKPEIWHNIECLHDLGGRPRITLAQAL